jgi:predicted MPP superfamily phosphohydrolase
MARRIVFFLGLLALLNAYAGYSIISRSAWAEAHPIAAWLIVLAIFLLQLAGPFGERLFFKGLRARFWSRLVVQTISWSAYVAFGIMSCMLFFGLITGIVTGIWQIVAPPTDAAGFNHTVLVILGTVTALTVVVGLVQARGRPMVLSVDVPLRNLPAAFDGFKIAQISDLHVGPTIGRRYTQRVVDITNDLAPDAVALTGDFVDGSTGDFAADAAPLAQLRAPYGTFYVTGNHEYHWDAAQWMALFKEFGARVLVNEHVLIRKGGDALVMAGVTDISTRHMGGAHASDPMRAVAGAPETAPKILLAHQPTSFEAAEKAGIDLQLSGHTHAGQYFPFSMLIGFFQRYVKGLNRHGDMWIYVNRGTGYWGPPLRTGVPPEITLITLRA